MLNILVTGAHGQLGSEINEIHSQYPNYNFCFTDVDSLDITDEQKLTDFFDSFKPQIVINCAAYTAVDKAEEDRHMADLVNVTASGNLARQCNLSDALLIHISTDYVFNGKSFTPYKETDQTDPVSYYGKSKLDGEKAIAALTRRSIIIRTSWLYSYYGKNFVKTMLKLAHERGELRVIADQIGSPTYASDLAKLILDIIPQRQKIQSNEIFHFANEGVISWYDFAVAIVELSGLKCKVVPIETKDYPTPASRPAYSVMNKNKIKSTFGLEIPYWRNSLKLCITRLFRLS
jgi:dTDP-4-dehydrorhamnose reductase